MRVGTLMPTEAEKRESWGLKEGMLKEGMLSVFNHWEYCYGFIMCYGVLSQLVVSDSSRLMDCRLLWPWGFSMQEYGSGLLCPSPEDLPNPRMEARSPAVQAVSLPAELPGKLIYGLLYMTLISGWFLLCPFLKCFYHKWVLNFVESFYWIYWDYHMFFIF